MSQQIQPESAGPKKLFGIIRYRSLAILIMLIGAAGFVVALLMFEEQVLCLFGSTLITIAGLSVNIASRRLGLDPVDQSHNIGDTPFSDVVRGGQVPPALRGRSGRKGPPSQAVAGSEILPDVAAASPAELNSGDLVERVLAVLESQGARVRLISSRNDRYILSAVVEGGRSVIVLVLEGDESVAVADARALLSMTTRTAGSTGYLIAKAAFPTEVYAWAADRAQIRLLNEGSLNELEI